GRRRDRALAPPAGTHRGEDQGGQERLRPDPPPMREAAANRAWKAATVVAHNLVAMLAQEVAAGNRHRLRERVADAVEEDDLRHAAPERVQPHNLQLVRRWLINVPARVVHRARQVFIRLAAGMLWREVFERTYARLTC